MSLIEKICEELGVRVGESWLGDTGKRYVINEYGQVRVWSDEYDEWIEPYYNLGHIINGELKPVWEPKEKERYFVPFIGYKTMEELYDSWDWVEGSKVSEWHKEKGLIFKTKEEAISMANKIIEFIKEERLNGGD